MVELRSQIVKELQTAETTLKKCGLCGDEAGLVVLYLLRIINSGKLKGVFNLRITGHHIGNPNITDQKVPLGEIREKFDTKTDFF